jgi:Terminase RNaseH-like domain
VVVDQRLEAYENLIREINKSRCTISIPWNDVPHLTEQAKEEMRRSTPEEMKSAREFGIPAIGSGLIYPVNPKDIKIKPIEIPVFWPRLYALDVGIRKTAALWMAWDIEEQTIYLYSEHYKSGLPSVHAPAIKARRGSEWIPGLIDPSARNRTPIDGRNLLAEYESYGLNLIPAKNAVESGITKVQEMFEQDRIKVFSTLTNFFDEIQWYRRDEHGRVVKQNDHLMDCLRYLIHGYQLFAVTKPTHDLRKKMYRPGIEEIGY